MAYFVISQKHSEKRENYLSRRRGNPSPQQAKGDLVPSDIGVHIKKTSSYECANCNVQGGDRKFHL